MLDRQLNAVLTVLNDFSDGAYKIIDADEIIAKLIRPQTLRRWIRMKNV